ncbi:MAG: hypothetical protein AAFW01_07780 [Pseudomonadota bacterium]
MLKRNHHPTDYEPWQIVLIAQRLLAYYTHMVLVTPTRSWITLAEELIAAAVTSLAFDENEPDLEPGDNPDKHFPVKGEVLRRFAQRISTVPKDLTLLDDIRDFLIWKGFLSASELEPHAAPFHLHCTLAQLFGAQCFASPEASTSRFAGDFLGRYESGDGTVETLLSMVPSPEGGSLQIRETYLQFRRRSPEPLFHLKGRVERCEPCRIASRDGVALVTPRSGVIFGLCEEASEGADGVPGSVFLVRDVAFQDDRVQSFALTGQHHLHDADAVTFIRCTSLVAFKRMRQIAARLAKGPDRSR